MRLLLILAALCRKIWAVKTDKVGHGDVDLAEYIGSDVVLLDLFDVQQIQQPRLLQMQSVQASHSISRKPVPTRLPEQPSENTYDHDDASPIATPLSNDSSRNNSLRDAYFDQDALDRILDDNNDRTSTMHSVASTEPDYASTVSSNHEERIPVERPRAGKLKTVGNPDLVQHAPKEKPGKYEAVHHSVYKQSPDVPNINFGPTYAYKPSGRPGSSGTALDPSMEGRSRSRSKDRLRSSGRNTPGGLSPGESYRHSYYGGAPDGENSRDQSRRQSVAWTPSGGSPNHQQRPSLTPEQWVQQRSYIATLPQYAVGATAGIAHQRTGSSGSFNAQQQQRKSMTKTPPPFGRAYSGDWTQQVQDQRTPPSRPHSRSASMYLDKVTAQQTQPAPPSRRNSRGASMYLDQQPSRPNSRSAGVYLDTQPSRPNSRSAGMYLDQQQQPSRPNSRGAGVYLDQQHVRSSSRGAGVYLDQQHVRSSSRGAGVYLDQQQPPSRRNSRSAGMYLAQPSGLVQSSQPATLSAREQMHIARATGTPLLDTSANARKKQQVDEKANAGLVGAIGAREREKAAMKTSHRSSMVVENAIRARQDQQAEAQMQVYQQQMQQMQQQQHAMYYGQQQGHAQPGTPGAQYGYAGGYAAPMQAQQPQQSQVWQQQQQQGAQTPGNRQSWFGGSYFGQPPQQGGQ
jgi:hypothetical protein